MFRNKLMIGFLNLNIKKIILILWHWKKNFSNDEEEINGTVQNWCPGLVSF